MVKKSSVLCGILILLLLLVTSCTGSAGQPGGGAATGAASTQKTGTVDNLSILKATTKISVNFSVMGAMTLTSPGRATETLSAPLSFHSDGNLVWSGTSFTATMQNGTVKGIVSADGSKVVSLTVHRVDSASAESTLGLTNLPLQYRTNYRDAQGGGAGSAMKQYVSQLDSHDSNLQGTKKFTPSDWDSQYGPANLSVQFLPQ